MKLNEVPNRQAWTWAFVLLLLVITGVYVVVRSDPTSQTGYEIPDRWKELDIPGDGSLPAGWRRLKLPEDGNFRITAGARGLMWHLKRGSEFQNPIVQIHATYPLTIAWAPDHGEIKDKLICVHQHMQSGEIDCDELDLTLQGYILYVHDEREAVQLQDRETLPDNRVHVSEYIELR